LVANSIVSSATPGRAKRSSATALPGACFTPEAVTERPWLLCTKSSSAMTLREMAGVAANGQWTEVDAGLPLLVESGHAIGARAHFRFGSPANR
jgi:hypothetical protein